MSFADTRFVITDVETFGLDPERDPIIEIGMMLVTLDFRVIDRHEVLVWEAGIYDQCFRDLQRRAKTDKTAKLVFDMHTKSGLWAEAQTRGVGIQAAINDTLEWCDKIGMTGEDPMVGSSVGFDRGMFKFQMPDIESRFFRRNIDISSIKELCKRWNPEVFSKLNVATQPKKLHRSLSDCLDTADELRFYYENFLWVA